AGSELSHYCLANPYPRTPAMAAGISDHVGPAKTSRRCSTEVLTRIARPATMAANEERQDGGQQAATEAGIAVRLACIGQDDARARTCRRLWRGAPQP